MLEPELRHQALRALGVLDVRALRLRAEAEFAGVTRHKAKPPHKQESHGRKGPRGVAKSAEKAVGQSVRMADLLSASPEQKDAAIRSVFEGEFGGLRTKVTRTGGGAGELFVEGDVFNRSGRKVGNYTRSIGVEDGQVWANHSTMEIDRGVQGSGFASKFNGAAIDWYRRTGVDGVYLHANADVGGYAWASQGFDFADTGSATVRMDELRDTVTALRSGRAKNRFGETIPSKLRTAPDLDGQLRAADDLLARADTFTFGEPGYPTAYEISQVGRLAGAGKKDTWLGKDNMLGSSWQGVLRLSGGGP